MSGNELTESPQGTRLVTLGRLCLVPGSVAREGPSPDSLDTLNKQRRKLAVLVVLALSQRPIQRDALIGMFWGDQEEARARHSLTEALSHLRRALGRDAIATRVAEVSFDPAQCGLDVDALMLAEAVRSKDFERGIRVCGGPFLDAIHLDDAPAFERWVDRERARLDDLFFAAAAGQCHALARARRWDECADVAAAWLERAPLSADAALYRLNALKADGSRDSALRALDVYSRLRERLKTELDLGPDAAVTRLASEIEGRLAELPVASDELVGRPGERKTPLRLVPERMRPAPELRPRARPKLPRALLVAAVGTAVVGSAAAVAFTFSHRQAQSLGPSSSTLAVLPFTHTGGDSTTEYLTSGIGEEMTKALSRVRGVRIVASTSIARLRERGASSLEIGRQLGADALVEGSVRTRGDSADADVRLVSAKQGRALWSQRYTRDLRHVADIREDAARAIATALGARAQRDVVSRPDPPRDAATYDLYLRGRYLENRSGEENLRRAQGYFEQAIARDSSFAAAYAELANVHMAQLFWGRSYGEVAPRARAYADRALQIDPALPDAHAALADLLRHDWRWVEAELEYRRVLAVNPSDAATRHALSHLYLALGRVDESMVESREALALDPLNPRIGMHLCVHYLFAHRYDDALAACRRGLELDPNFPDSHAKLGWVFLAQGRYADAASEVEREMAVSGRVPEYELELALTEAARGRSAQALAILRDVERRVPAARRPLVTAAGVHLRLGNADAALARLEEAYLNHSPELENLTLEPMFDPIRSDSRFQALMGKLGLSDDPLAVRAAGRPSASAPLTRVPTAIGAVSRRALAVLPFTHAGSDKSSEYFTAGLTDELTNALSTVPGLRVVARTSVNALRARNLDARALAQRLRADVLLEGSVLIDGDRARIVAQLVDAESGYRIWSGRYDRQMRDVLAVQDEIASTIVTALQLQLANDPPQSVVRGREPNPSARDLYLRGRYVAERRGEANFRTALTNFEQAIALDSSYALAWAGLASTRVSLADRGLDAREMFDGARFAAERAVRLDSLLAEPHVALGRVQYYRWDWAGAERELRHAVELNPNDADARHWYAHVLMILGRTGEANVQQSRMLELDPYGPQSAFHPCWQAYELRQFARALAACRAALEVHPNQPEAHTKIGFVFSALRMHDSAVTAFAREREITPGVPTASANLAMALAAAGRTDSARAELRALERATAPERLPPMDVACAYLALGDIGRALSVLEQAAEGRRRDIGYARGHRDLAHIKYEPCLDPARGSARFARVIRSLGVP